MIGLDTNVVIRFLMQDDETQSRLANKVFARLTRARQGFVSAVVLAEISWVLSRAYKASRDEIADTIRNLLEALEISIEHSDAAWRALAAYEASSSVDFADALIAETAKAAGAEQTYTFDRIAARDAGMALLT